MTPPKKKKTNGKTDGNGAAAHKKPNGSGALSNAMRDVFYEHFNPAFKAAAAPHIKELRQDFRREIQDIRREIQDVRRDVRRDIRQETDKGRKKTVAEIRAMLIPALAKVGRELRDVRVEQKRLARKVDG